MTLPSSHSYVFILGRTPALSLAELASIFPNQSFEKITEGVMQTTLDGLLDANHWMSKLGGTVKIVRVIEETSSVSPEYLAVLLSQLASDKKISFGISVIGVPAIGINVLQRIKELLAQEGKSSRFVLPKHGEISSVVVEKQGIMELVILATKNGTLLIGHTIAVQPFEEWSSRDYGRPFADPKAGMLPPKVARMAVNLALLDKPSTILDPFCGMGTILAEAMMLGHMVVGSDNKEEVTKKTQKNLQWLTLMYRSIEMSFNVFVSDATHVSEKLTPQSVDAIVTEPFLGNVSFDQRNIQNIIKGLEKLYLGCLKDWRKVLKTGGRVVMALPKYVVNNREYFVKTVIDRCEILGYTTLLGPIEYSRPQAVVRREFYVFKKLD